MIKKAVSTFFDFLRDTEKDLAERVFVIFSVITEFTLLIALAGDIYFKEDINEIIVLIALIIMIPAVTYISYRKNRIRFAIYFFVASLVIFVLPGLFFFGGGLRGGGVLWIIFAFMYVGLVISGRLRAVVFIILCFETLAFYLLGYYHPELVIRHDDGTFYADSFISIILVGLVCFLMNWTQNELFRIENERAKREKERAEELTRSQNRFFSTMSHEIRTPINSILGLNELILRNPKADDEIIKDSTGIQGAGKLLLSLINDILDFSKIEAGSMDIVPVEYNVEDMLSD